MERLGPIYGKTGTGNKETAGNSNPLPLLEFALLVFPSRTITNRLQAFLHPQAAHVEIVAGDVSPLHDVSETHFDGVHPQFLRDCVKLLLPRGPGGNSTVSPLRAVGRFVGIDPVSVVFHVRQPVRRSQKRTGVIDRGDAEAGIGTSIKIAGVLQGHQGTVLFHPRCQLVEELVARPAVEKDLFPGEGHLHRSSRPHGHEACREFEGAGRSFRPEPSTYIRLRHPHLPHGQTQHHRKGPLDVMRYLR